ncbi:MAG: hypothetical protein Q4P13_05835 [Psychrobacter sp.]|nr:hypothetical protein [Psychrobacter sp.]
MKKHKKAANTPKAPQEVTFGTIWQQKGLNPNLVAKIRPLIEGNLEGGQGNQTYEVDPNEPTVLALLDDAEFSVEAQYSTPFESSNPEGRLPNLMGMVQSGQMAAAGYSFMASTTDPTGVSGALGQGALMLADLTGVNEIIAKGYEQLEGLLNRSNFTKINSRQIYTSSNSVRINGTLMFQAWSDAQQEVEAAVQKLQEWASPKQLSNTSIMVGVSEEGFTEALFPSVIPPLVQLQYGGCTYKPMFIESVSAPIAAPMTPSGNRIAVKVNITFLSLSAWDKGDIINLRR